MKQRTSKPPLHIKHRTPISVNQEQEEDFVLDCDSLKSLKEEMKDAKKLGMPIVFVEFDNLRACKISKKIRPELDRMAMKFHDQRELVLFMRLECAQPGVGWKYKLHCFPTYIIFKYGKEAYRMVGPQVGVDLIKDKIQGHLNKLRGKQK